MATEISLLLLDHRKQHNALLLHHPVCLSCIIKSPSEK